MLVFSKNHISHNFGEDNTYKTTTLAMGRKRKGTAAKSVDSDIHTDQDKTSISHNGSQKDSKVMEQMTPVKKANLMKHKPRGKNYPHDTSLKTRSH